MRLVDADALAVKLRHMGYMDENEEVQEVIDRFAEECDDELISKRDAIDALCHVDEYNARSVKAIKALPSVESKRKTGRWTIEDVHSATYKYCCSECKAHHRARYDFCPTCGAKMSTD